MMTATTEPPPRIAMLDIVRGIAVMGILLMNIVNFGLPEHALLTPDWRGPPSAAELWTWAVSFVFVEGKMRALFSLLFGAGMLLVADRAEAAGQSAETVHMRRMAWLFLFGLVHFFFIWRGDILHHYALIGILAFFFHARSQRSLLKLAIAMFVLDFLMAMLFYGSSLMLQLAASAPDASADTIRLWEDMRTGLGGSDAELAADIAIHQGSYGGIVEHQFRKWSDLILQALLFGPETLGLMLLGMWSLRSGFITGHWERRRYWKVAAIGLAIAVPGYALIAWQVHRIGFGPIAVLAGSMIGGAVLRSIMALAYAALIILVAGGGAGGAIKTRVAAAGRAAFSNYLGTSIVATFIFYGWGFGLYGTVSRTWLYPIALAICALMLLWSKPWLERYRYGPLEWLWRSLARGEAQPMRKLDKR